MIRGMTYLVTQQGDSDGAGIGGGDTQIRDSQIVVADSAVAASDCVAELVATAEELVDGACPFAYEFASVSERR